jgi:RNase H-fold protein (predicted Holliday junction resolvase)
MAKVSTRFINVRYEIVVAVDPGRDKCGYAVVELRSGDSETLVLSNGIATTSEIGRVVANQLAEHLSVKVVVVGDGTNSGAVVDNIKCISPNVEIRIVNERGTSEAARKLFVSRTPAEGFEKLLPRSLRSPKTAYDNVVAELIGRNFLESQ